MSVDSGPRSHSEIAAPGELLVPPLGVWRYLGFGAEILPRTRSVVSLRLLRALLSIAAAMAPVTAVIGMTISAVHQGNPSEFDAFFARWTGSPDAATILLMGAIGATGLLLILRALVESLLFGAMRDAALETRTRTGIHIRRRFAGYLAVGTLQVGLLTGGMMFLSPVAVKVAQALMADPSSPQVVSFAVGASALASMTLIYLRYVVMLIAAYLTWRPDFVAGSIIAALAVPFREFRLFARFGSLWGGIATSFAVLTVSIAWPLFGLVLRGEWNWVSPVRVLGALCLVVVALAAEALMDTALVAMVGHRLGELDGGEEVLAHARPNATLAQKQERLEPAIRGIFALANESEAARPASIVSFRAILGYEPQWGDRESWVAPDAFRELRAGEEFRSAGGATEVVFGTSRLSVISNPPADSGDDSSITFFSGNWPESGVGEQRFSELGGCAPALLRSAGGAAERRWRAASGPTQRSQ